MIYSIPDQIGILACPGGAAFAARLSRELEGIARKKMRHKLDTLAQKYGLPREELLKQVNLNVDLRPTSIDLQQPAAELRATHFRVPARFARFANGEFKAEILTSIRNTDVYVVQDVANQYPVAMIREEPERFPLSVNDHVFCLITAVDAALHAGAKGVTAVLPSYPYSRQHKKKGREGLSAARFGQFLEFMGVKRIITLDLHSKEIENSFNLLRVENLHASYQILKVLASVVDLAGPDLVIISADTGSIDRNKFYATALGRSLGMIYKERDYSRISTSAKQDNITNVRLLGSVEGKTVFMADDMLGTGGTLIRAMRILKERGAARIICAVSLPFFNGNAIEVFEEAYREGLFHRIIGTNAVYHDKNLLGREWFLSADVSSLFGRSLYRLHANRSLSSLLDNRDMIKDLLGRSRGENPQKELEL